MICLLLFWLRLDCVCDGYCCVACCCCLPWLAWLCGCGLRVLVVILRFVWVEWDWLLIVHSVRFGVSVICCYYVCLLLSTCFRLIVLYTFT